MKRGDEQLQDTETIICKYRIQGVRNKQVTRACLKVNGLVTCIWIFGNNN